MHRSGPRERVSLTVPVVATVEGYPQPIPVTIIELSESGCRMTGRSVFLVGAALEFPLPLSKGKPPLVHGKVRRCTQSSEAGLLEYGIEFASLASEDLLALRDFLKEERDRPAAAAVPARIEVEFPVTYLLPKQKDPIDAIAIDLGRGGMCVACPTQLPQNGTITLRFTLPNDDGAELVMQGRIVERRQQFREYHHNVSFVSPDERSLERIARFIRATTV